MPATPVFAISLSADNTSAQPIRALWGEVAQFEDAPSMQALGYPPHITLAIYDATLVAAEQARTVLAEAIRGATAPRAFFESVRIFDSDALILWAAPQPSPDLHRLHNALHRRIDPALCHPHYRPDAWIPHCTLGTRIRPERRDAARAFAKAFTGRFAVDFDSADCVSFPPVVLLESHRLPIA